MAKRQDDAAIHVARTPWLVPRAHAPQLYEQVLGQRDDFAIVMLWLERAEEDEEEDLDEDRTSKERFRERQARFR